MEAKAWIISGDDKKPFSFEVLQRLLNKQNWSGGSLTRRIRIWQDLSYVAIGVDHPAVFIDAGVFLRRDAFVAE